MTTRAEEERNAEGMTEHSRRVLAQLREDPRRVREVAYALSPDRRGDTANAHRGGVARALEQLCARGYAVRVRLPLGTGYKITPAGAAEHDRQAAAGEV